LDGAQVFILPLPSAHNLDSCIFERRRQQLSLAACASWMSAGWRGTPYGAIWCSAAFKAAPGEPMKC
jgi:hypothetical protein